MQAVEELSRTSGALPAYAALGVARATPYRHRGAALGAPSQAQPQRSSPRALRAEERQAELAELHSERFVDQAPAAVYAALLYQARYL